MREIEAKEYREITVHIVHEILQDLFKIISIQLEYREGISLLPKSVGYPMSSWSPDPLSDAIFQKREKVKHRNHLKYLLSFAKKQSPYIHVLNYTY